MSETWTKHTIENVGAGWQTVVRDKNHLGVFIAYGDTLEECEKRRDLFAAAPELLEALKAMIRIARLHQVDGDSSAMRDARAIIAKAEGRE